MKDCRAFENPHFSRLNFFGFQFCANSQCFTDATSQALAH